MQDLTIRDLTTEELPSILPLIELHNAKIAPEVLRRRLEAMIPHGYHCIAAFQEERMVGVAGYWVGAKFWCGEYLEADNVFVLPELRSEGIGAKMMDYLEAKALTLGCKVVALDSYVTFAGAHKFYFRRGYEIAGFHFIRKASDA
ncbi:MAG: GNAT family N-acetyltransferase [Roseimicrobium sp.]